MGCGAGWARLRTFQEATKVAGTRPVAVLHPRPQKRPHEDVLGVLNVLLSLQSQSALRHEPLQPQLRSELKAVMGTSPKGMENMQDGAICYTKSLKAMCI